MDKAPKRKVVKRPKGTAARIEKEVAAKLAKAKAQKKARKKVVKKKPVSKLTYAEVVDNDSDDSIFTRAQENAQDGLTYGGIDWIDGVSPRDDQFWHENHYKYDQLSEKKQARIEKIEDKILNGLGPSVEKELKRHFKAWKEQNKDKNMSLKEAQDAFGDFYF